VRITAGVNAARRRALAAAAARHGNLPGIRMADKTLEQVTCIRLDASVVTAHSDNKELAEPDFKGFGHHPLLAYCDKHRRAAGRETAPRRRRVQHGRRSSGGPGRGDRRAATCSPAAADDHLRWGRRPARG
jgi:hypothetical protein